MIEPQNSQIKEYAIYVCAKCQNLVLVPKESFTSSEETPNDFSNTNNHDTPQYLQTISHQNLSPLTIDLSFHPNDWLYLEKFVSLQQKASSFPNFPFPICPKCINSYNKMTASIESNEKVQKSFSFLMKQLSFNSIEHSIHQIEDDVNNLTTKIRSFSSIPQTTLLSPIDPFESHFKAPKLKREEFKIQQSKTFYEIDRDFPLQKTHALTLIIATTFVIGTDRHYITINNMRIGFYLYSRNTVEENNIGLSFVSHLLYYLLYAYHISFEHFVIYPSGMIRKTEDNSQYYLKIPTKRHLSDIKKFNVALNMLFTAAYHLFSSNSVQSNCGAPPFEININQRTIEHASYVFDDSVKSLEKWSLAMKYLLFNLKLVQIRSSTEFLSK